MGVTGFDSRQQQQEIISKATGKVVNMFTPALRAVA